jgi:ABC-2 type transport system permease protein
VEIMRFKKIPLVPIISVVLLAAIAFGLGKIPDGIMERDLSSNAIYEVSETSKTALRALTDDIEIIVLAPELSVEPFLIKFINKYAALSPRISVKYVDPAVDPGATDVYGSQAGNVVVRSASTGRQKAVPMMDFSGSLVTYDQNAYYSYGQLVPVSFDADGQLTRAINYAIGAELTTAYLLTGHSETDFPSGALSTLDKANIDTAPLNILQTGAIPKDCDLLICYNPQADLAKEELDTIGVYLRDGGRVLLLLDLPELPNFNSILADYGLQMLPGHAADTERYYAQFLNSYGYNCIYPVLSTTSDVTTGLTADALLLYPRAMLEVTPIRRDAVVTAFLTTSPEGGANYTSEEDVAYGEYILGAVSVEAFEGRPSSRLTVLSAVSMLDDAITTSFPGVSNLDVFIGAVGASLDGARPTAIPAKSMALTYNTLKNTTLWSAFFLAAVPLGFIIVGLYNWRHRKSR